MNGFGSSKWRKIGGNAVNPTDEMNSKIWYNHDISDIKYSLPDGITPLR